MRRGSRFIQRHTAKRLYDEQECRGYTARVRCPPEGKLLMPVRSSDLPQRKKLRWDGHDYRSQGLYFVTICTHQRRCIFGEVDGDVMILNSLGLIAEVEWWRSMKMRPEISPGSFIIMPNHIHGLVAITPQEDLPPLGPFAYAGRTRYVPTRTPRSLGSFIAGFKAAATKRINEARRSPGVPVWQRNYYDHVIRNEADLARVEQYMATNPERWAAHRENPDRS